MCILLSAANGVIDDDSVFAKKNKANYILAQRHQTADKRRNAYDYVFHLTCVMPVPGEMFQTIYNLAINKSVK